MSLRTVARRYANALFDVASKNGTLDQAERELREFAELVSTHADLRQVLGTPAVASPKKRAVVEALLARTGGTHEVGRLLLMLADRDRLMLLPQVAAAFAERLMEARHVLAAEVTTAVPLAVPQRDALTAALRKAAGSEVAVTEHVDPSIIGGVIARVGSVVYDGSVTRQIERMKQRLLEEA